MFASSQLISQRRSIRIAAFLFAIVFVSGTKFASANPLDDLPAGHWVEIPNSKLQEVFPNPTPPGITGPKSVMYAWSGGAYDTNRDRLIVWGGGHGDYSGNEVYVFDINSLSWTRLTEPSSDVGGSEGSGVYPDGRPRSRHTYGNIGYAPNADKFVSFGGAAMYPDSLTDSKTHLFDFNTNQWSLGQTISSVGWRFGATAYDPVTGKLFYFGGGSSGRFVSYDPVTDNVQLHASRSAEIYAVSAIDPGRRIMVTVGGYGGTPQLFKLDLDNPNAAPVNLLPQSSGATELESGGGIGFVFDPVSDKFVAWHGGSSVYTLDPDTWVWTRVSPASGNSTVPTAAEAHGTYGRFQYIPSRNAFITVNRTNENVYFYRLTPGAGNATGPALNFSASAGTIESGENVVLSWSSATADSCSASGGWSGGKATAGSETLGPLFESVTFTLACTNADGTTTHAASVAVTAPPDVVAPSVPTGLNGQAVSASLIDLSWNAATDSGGSGVSLYHVFRDGDEIGTSSGLAYSDNFLAADTTYQYSVSAVDGAGNASQQSAPVAVTTLAGSPGDGEGIRVNAGGEAYIDSAGRTWSADTGFNTGNESFRTYPIDGTAEDALFQTERWDAGAAPELMYSFDVPNGDYVVNLLFAEFYEGAYEVGARVFDVTIEGQAVLNDLDIFSEAGSNAALFKSFSVTVADGQLNIGFLHQVDNPKVSAIEILAGDSTSPPPPSPAPTVSLGADPLTVEAGGSSTLSWSSTGATACSAGGAWSGSKGTSGSQSVGPLSANSTFTLSCSGAGGTASDSVAVQVSNPPVPVPAPTLSFSISPDTIPVGGSGTLSWVTTEASACEASGNWSGPRAVQGSELVGPVSGESIYTLSCSGAGGSVSKTVNFSLIDNDADSDGLPDDWEQQYFGNLDQDANGDFDGDGLSNGQEYGLGTNPGNSDSDGDGESDYEEAAYGSDPNDSGDTWQAHRPYKPVVAAQGVAPLRDHVFDVGQAYGDPDGDPLGISEWQVSAEAGFSALTLYRGVFEQTAVPAPMGVLTPATQYWVRTRHRDSKGLPSEWSDAVQFTTEAAYPNDADGNGVDDDYQVEGFVDTDANGISDPAEGMCNLYDAEGRNPIGFRSSAGTLQCFTSLGGSDLSQEQIPEGGLAYGAFSFMVTDLPVDPEAPASVSVTVYFPQDLSPDTGWYKYDEAIQDYADFSSNASVEGNTVTLTLVDGADGDQDGVVNGVIIDPSGPANTTRSQSGGGAVGWLLLSLLFLALRRRAAGLTWSRRTN